MGRLPGDAATKVFLYTEHPNNAGCLTTLAATQKTTKAPRNYLAAEEALGKTIQPEVPAYETLSPEAQAAYDSIEVFAKKGISGLFFNPGRLRRPNGSWISSTQTTKNTQ